MHDDDITEADLDTAEGEEMIRIITNRYLQNTNQEPLAELHSEDAAIHLEEVKEVFRAFIQVSNEIGD